MTRGPLTMRAWAWRGILLGVVPFSTGAIAVFVWWVLT